MPSYSYCKYYIIIKVQRFHLCISASSTMALIKVVSSLLHRSESFSLKGSAAWNLSQRTSSISAFGKGKHSHAFAFLDACFSQKFACQTAVLLKIMRYLSFYSKHICCEKINNGFQKWLLSYFIILLEKLAEKIYNLMSENTVHVYGELLCYLT